MTRVGWVGFGALAIWVGLMGNMARGGELEPIVVEGEVAAPPSAIWEVFSTSAGWRKLGVAKAEVDLRLGGSIRTHYDPMGKLGDDQTIANQILAFEPGRSMTIRIEKPPRGFPFPNAWQRTWTVLTFAEREGGASLLRIAMFGFGPDEESRKMREFFKHGNQLTLRTLQAALKQSGTSTDRPAAGQLDPIDVAVEVAAPGADVWKAWTTSEGWRAFFGVTARVGSRPAEPFEIEFAEDAPAGQRGSEGCIVLSLVPEEMFSFTWNAPPTFEHARQNHTWVVITFEPISPGSTRVRLRALGFADQAATHPEERAEWVQVRSYFAAAWPKVLEALADHFRNR